MPRKTMLRAALLAALLATSSALAALPALRTSPAHTPRCRVARCVQAGEALPLEAASADAAAAAATPPRSLLGPPRSLLGQASEAADAVYAVQKCVELFWQSSLAEPDDRALYVDHVQGSNVSDISLNALCTSCPCTLTHTHSLSDNNK